MKLKDLEPGSLFQFRNNNHGSAIYRVVDPAAGAYAVVGLFSQGVPHVHGTGKNCGLGYTRCLAWAETWAENPKSERPERAVKIVCVEAGL